jgi:hypothetical protein
LMDEYQAAGTDAATSESDDDLEFRPAVMPEETDNPATVVAEEEVDLMGDNFEAAVMAAETDDAPDDSEDFDAVSDDFDDSYQAAEVAPVESETFGGSAEDLVMMPAVLEDTSATDFAQTDDMGHEDDL